MLQSVMRERLDPWVRLMADYSSDGLWHRDGVMMSQTDLPVSEALRSRIEKWCDWYEKFDLENIVAFDYMKFSIEGEAIAWAIKAALPGWTVLYFDEAKALTAYLAEDAIPRDILDFEIKASDDGQNTESHPDQSISG